MIQQPTHPYLRLLPELCVPTGEELPFSSKARQSEHSRANVTFGATRQTGGKTSQGGINSDRNSLTLLLLSLISGLLWPGLIQASVAHLATPTSTLAIPITSWVQQRDAGVVKQELDHSCGAASLATILNEYYGQSVTEAELLETMDKGDLRASFADMAAALPHYGFRGIGLAASYEQLSQLTAPVIAYLHYRDNDHFSVIRGIDEHTVWLADPAMGNRTYSREQFLQMWATRDDAIHPGRLLAILPLEHTVSSNPAYFSNQPRRQTASALNLPTLQPLR